MASRRPYTFDRVVRLILLSAFLAFFVWLLMYLSDVLLPFVAAALVAYLIHPAVVWVHRYVRQKVFSVVIVVSVLLLVLSGAAYVVVPIVAAEAEHTGRVVAQLFQDSDLANRARGRLPDFFWTRILPLLEGHGVEELLQSQTGFELVQKILPEVWRGIGHAGSLIMALVAILLGLLYLILILVDYERLTSGWKNFLPPRQRPLILEFVRDFEQSMGTYFRAQAGVASSVGVLFVIGFLIIDLPLAIVLGLFLGLLNMVPYLQIVGAVPAFILAGVHALETGQSFWVAMALTAAVFIVVQSVQDGVLIPKIMGDATGLSPAIIILSLSIWGKLLGLFGLLIAIPMTCLIGAYYQRFLGSSSPKLEDPPQSESAQKQSDGQGQR